MTIQITNRTCSQYSDSATFTCGKVTAYVHVFAADGRINVGVQNASHRIWKGSGKFFSSWDDAVGAYKSGEMKALLSAAQTELTAN